VEEFLGRTLVLRVDGESTADGTTFYEDIAFLAARRIRPIVIAPDAEVARNVVRTMNRSSEMAVGLSGADAGMLPAASQQALGSVQVRLLTTLMNAGYVPVIEPTAMGLTGSDVEIAADDVASAIASATTAARAIFFHESGGVIDAVTASLIDELTPAEALTIADSPGLPEDLRSAIRAAAQGVRGGVNAAQIFDGRIAHAMIVELLTARHLGTQVAGTVLLATCPTA
jgi:acetylglutamate kinase